VSVATLPPPSFIVRALEPLLKLPSAPVEPPQGARHPRVFRASVQYLKYRYLKLGAVILLELYGAAGLVTGAFAIHAMLGVAVIVAVLLLTIGIILFFYAAIRLDYDLHQYVVTDRALRVRSGAISVQEVTITYANVQDVEVQQGPLQRFFGISDLVVRTAGGSVMKKGEAGGSGGHAGSLRGIDNPQEVRTLVLDCLRAYRDSGLGDPDDPGHGAAGATATEPKDLAAATRELRAAASELRMALQGTH